MMRWFFSHVAGKEGDASDPRINLVDAKLDGLPPVTIINAEIDPLKSDGDMLAEKLKAAGVTVEHKVYTGVVHEFFGMAPLVAKPQRLRPMRQLNSKRLLAESDKATAGSSHGLRAGFCNA